MGTLVFESVKTDADKIKIYFTSYLREDFIEKSVVISLDKNYSITNIYLSSYDFGSLEWINGIGLTECRKWETDEQAESSGYLTRRYTSRISNGYAPDGHGERVLIPDVLDSMGDAEMAKLLKSVLKTRKTKRKIIPDKQSFTL